MRQVASIATAFSILACHVEPPSMPDDEAQRRARAQSEGRKAVARQADLESALALSRQTRDASADALRAAEAANEMSAQRQRAAAEEAKKYASALSEARSIAGNCAASDWARMVEVYAYLRQFASEPQRDAAIADLDFCRQSALKLKLRAYQDATVDLRKEFAVQVEEAFDENNPYSRGSLVAKIKGDKLQVSMRGNFEGRSRYSQYQVDAWCEQTSLFTSISLRNSHGTFTCRPSESPKEVHARLLREENLLDPWIPPASGERSTPVAREIPPPVSEQELARLRGALTAAEEALQDPELELAAARAKADKARAIIRRIDEGQRDRERAWRDAQQESAKTMNRAGVGVLAAGSVATGIGGYLGYLRATTQTSLDTQNGLGSSSEEAEEKLQLQTVGMTVGLIVGIPLLVTGALLIVAGKRRMDSTQTRVSWMPGAVEVRF